MHTPDRVDNSSSSSQNLLSVSPFREDHETLRIFLDPLKVLITNAYNRRDALWTMANQQFGLILCEAQLNWRDILSYLAEVLDPPRLVITSRLADERLWAEALNLGSWDVLIKPFDGAEVRRVVTSALGHRSERFGRSIAA
jgi:DNA-binding response OmpR family regulator